MNAIKIRVPTRCVNCGFPNKLGVEAIATITLKEAEPQTVKEWKCPECGNKTTYILERGKYKEAKEKLSRYPLAGTKKERLTRDQIAPDGRIHLIND